MLTTTTRIIEVLGKRSTIDSAIISAQSLIAHKGGIERIVVVDEAVITAPRVFGGRREVKVFYTLEVSNCTADMQQALIRYFKTF